MIGRYGSPRKPRKRPVISGRCKALCIRCFRPGGIFALYSRHQVIAQFLAEGISQRIQAGVLQVILYIECRCYNYQRLNVAPRDHVIQHGFISFVGAEPVILIIARAVHQVKDIVFLALIISVGQIDQCPLVQRPAVRAVCFGFIDKLFQRPGIFTRYTVQLRGHRPHGVAGNPGCLLVLHGPSAPHSKGTGTYQSTQDQFPCRNCFVLFLLPEHQYRAAYS